MADEELKVLLRENIEVSKESLKILKKINRGRIFGNVCMTLKVDVHNRHFSRGLLLHRAVSFQIS